MNTMFGKVLQEVLMGLPIAEPNMSGVGSKEDVMEQKGF